MVPCAALALYCSTVSPAAAMRRAWNGVKIGPGPTAFTRMPSGEWSAASARVKPAIADLVVSYCRLPPPATTERTEATLTMAPPWLRRISGTAALAQKTYLIRLTSRISFQLAALASSTFSYLRMPALLMRMSRRPNFCAAPLTKSRHAASVPTSACVKATLAPAVSSSAATRWPRSPSRSQNATLAPSATKRLTVASPIPDAPPVTAATLPSSLPMFATFHCIAKRASTIRRIHPAGTALLARPGCPTLTDCRSFKRPLSGPFDGLTRSDLGRIEPLPLAWSCDRLRRNLAVHGRCGEGRLFTLPGSSPLSREGPVWDHEELFPERG